MNETNRDADLLDRIEREHGRTFDVSLLPDAAEMKSALRRLLRSRRLARASRGVYTILEKPQRAKLVDDDELRLATAPFADTPHYVSWRAALSRHNLTEQDPRVIAVAMRTRRESRKIAGLRIRPVYQSADRFYGFRRIKVASGGEISLATPEKAILDSLDRPDLGGGLPEVVKALNSTQNYDPNELVRLARRFPSQATIARLGYLMSTLKVGDPTPLQSLIRRKGPPVMLWLLEPEERSSLDADWRVTDNVGMGRLRVWADR
jgi:predicted transcriptional regulator of viral defense system